MAAPVYSTQFIALSSVGGGSNTFTVPAGYRAVITDIRLSASGAASPIIEVYLNGPNVVLAHLPASGSGEQVVAVTGRMVLNAGQELAVYVGGTSAFGVLVSGYLLTTP